MAFTEDRSVFLADFGQACTLAGSPVQAIVDTETTQDFDSGALTQTPSALLQSSAAAAAAPGQAFNAGSTAYTVRQVLREPPDGAMTRLILARA